MVVTRRFREHGSIAATLPLAPMPGTDYATNYDALADAYFMRAGGIGDVFLAEAFKLITGTGKRSIEITDARAASALMHTRTVEGTKQWENKTAGYMVSDLLGSLTGPRAISLAFGTGTAIGASFSLQRSWGDLGDVVMEILAAQQLGMATRFDGATVKLDVIVAADSGVLLGEKYGDGSAQRLVRDDKQWRNYAYVLGEGEGAARVKVEVDQTAGNERREIYVDASDLQQGTLTLAQYQAQLAARGAAALAETRRIEYAETDEVTAPLNPGDIVWSQSANWAESYMVTEVATSIEGGSVKHAVALGDPPPTLKKSIKRSR